MHIVSAAGKTESLAVLLDVLKKAPRLSVWLGSAATRNRLVRRRTGDRCFRQLPASLHSERATTARTALVQWEADPDLPPTAWCSCCLLLPAHHRNAKTSSPVPRRPCSVFPPPHPHRTMTPLHTWQRRAGTSTVSTSCLTRRRRLSLQRATCVRAAAAAPLPLLARSSTTPHVEDVVTGANVTAALLNYPSLPDGAAVLLLLARVVPRRCPCRRKAKRFFMSLRRGERPKPLCTCS